MAKVDTTRTINTKGKVLTYEKVTGALLCTRQGAFIWRGGFARTGASPNLCNPRAGTLDVTISVATANKLKPGVEFSLDYKDVQGSNKPVERFEVDEARVSDAASDAVSDTVETTSAVSLPLAGISAANPPSSMPPSSLPSQ